MGQVVWIAGQKPSFFAKYSDAARAMLFHYQRCLFGARYGMGA